MPDLSNAEISVEGEHGDCESCGESFFWERLVYTDSGYYCPDHLLDDDKAEWDADIGHDTNLERDTFGDAI